MIKCSNITNILNNMYDKKVILENDCLSKKHKYLADKIKLKLPERKQITLVIEEDDNIYNPLSYVLSHINNKKFKDKNQNKYSFNALLLILAIIEDYKIIELRKENSIISDKNILKKILPLLEINKTYKIEIPNKISYEFKVYGYELAVMIAK
tara:strand:- start:1824 stop:2282 length:459 start_codon:yes stop_codon:yes gene_type:complete